MKKDNTAKTFEELHIYQRARELTNNIYAVTKADKFSRDFGLVNQIRRAAVSIMSNIAEGFERGTNPEFIRFLYISKASSGEVRAQLQIAKDQKYISETRYNQLYNLAQMISSMISNFITRLQTRTTQNDKTNRAKKLNTNMDKNFIALHGVKSTNYD